MNLKKKSKPQNDDGNKNMTQKELCSLPTTLRN